MDDALIKRVLPHSVEAEQSVIGSMLMDREAIISASEIITADDFYQHQYGVMFESMVELFNENRPVDLITLQNRLKEKDVPPEVSSLDFVRDIITTVPTSANVKSYANIVREKAVLRRLIKINEDIANTCYVGKELYRSGLQDIGFTALRLCSDRRPSFHGKDGVRIESGRSYCSKKRAAVHGIQSGDVEGAVSKPYAGDGVQRRLTKASNRNAVRLRLGCGCRRNRSHWQFKADHR